MPELLDKSYNPQLFEQKIYQKWEASGYFNPDNLNLPESAPAYTIILPPPNITDKLHLGHASTVAIQDLLIRYHRLRGYRSLWLPGTDHAAIATQNVVEKKLKKEEGLSRHDLGREKFLERVWQFLEETQSTILYQIRRLGGSLDWSRQAFTLDEPRQKAVAKMFCDMYEAGAIYRGERIVNWCPRCHSTLADDEVEYKTQTAKLYTFKYAADFPIAISTTRPETKLGDTAVAVNPKDERYKEYVGQEYQVNFVGQPLTIKIIADHNVEMEFGTGALGVTPAHSAVDWQMAEKNNLAIKKIINEDGLIYNTTPEYDGLTALAARDKVVEKLKDAGLLIEEKEIENNLSVCYRCDTSIEPLPSKQWFVAVDKKLDRLDGQSLKEKALAVAQTGEVKFVPERFYKKYSDWINNLHDWCISRQIWFGHRIPVWYKDEAIYVGTVAPSEAGWTQDPDTLDTWFSSSMWTFSTLGWPDSYQNETKSGDLLRFHPTQVLETGYEIITLWVSRMIMMSLFAIKEIPFETVYLHGMILDKDGKKMSKSKGNGIDPVTVSDEFGTDAVRLSLLYGTTPGNDTRLGEEKIAAQRNFVNKLWNISRYILGCVEPKYFAAKETPTPKTLADKWIMNRFNNLIQIIDQRLARYEFSLAIEELNRFTWNELADWYLEIAKIEKDKEAILAYLLKNLLALWHPFIPFVTEVIWEQLGQQELLMVSAWPKSEKTEENNDFELIFDLVSSIRNARAENKIEPAQKIKAIIYAPHNQATIAAQAEIIKGLKTGISELTVMASGEKIEPAIFITLGEIEIYLIAEIDPEKEAQRISKEKENLTKMIQLLETKLGNQEFVSKAPEKIIADQQEKLKNYKIELEKLNNR